MNRFCTNCGKELPSNVLFCPNCGSRVEVRNNTTENNSSNNNNNNQTVINNYYNTSIPFLTKKDIAVSVILSFLTCGIYQIYWFITITDDANKVSERPTDTSGGLAFLLTLITCGIYGIYWNYKMGKKIYEAGKKYNKNIQDNSLPYLILSLFKLDIVSIALMQSDLNKFAE